MPFTLFNNIQPLFRIPRMSEIKNFDIRTQIIESLTETFDTMLSMPVQLCETDPDDSTGVSRMVGTVNFAGSVVGMVNIQVTTEMARLMSAGMLDMAPEQIEGDEEIKDLISEITNIIGGSLKSSLNDAGHPCVISTPAITYGSDFTIKSLNMARFEHLVFQYETHFILVEVGLKPQQPSEDGTGATGPDGTGQIGQMDIEKVRAIDIPAKVSGSLTDVFDTMLSMKLEAVDAGQDTNITGARNTGSVCFAGDVTGMVSIHVNGNFALQMAAAMLDMEPEEIEGDDEIRDLLGEIGNIVGGSLKSAFTDAGLACVLSTPAVTTGTDFLIEAPDMEKYERLAFRCDQEIVLVEMGIKFSDQIPLGEPGEKETAASHDDGQTEIKPQAAAAPPEKPFSGPADFGLDLLLDVPLELKVELGRCRIPIHELLKLNPGSAVKLVKLEGDPVDILANDTLIARGEVVVQNEKYGIRITEITGRMDRIRSFGI